jgi:predicted membrane-bound spermidine synthase
MVILLLFFFSGVTALIYEVIWSDYLTLIFGSTIQAQTVVLAVFMGGLALGNKLFGRIADRTRRSLVIYGCLELAIGVYALFFSQLYQLANHIFIPVGSKLLHHSGWLVFLNGALSVILLLGPTILMGGTLPVLAGWLQKSMADAGRLAARFYSVNTLGAVCGAWLAGFLLVEWLGLRLTTETAAAVNLLVGAIAVSLGRKPMAQIPAGEQPSGMPEPETMRSRADSKIFQWSCVLVAVTGAVSMGLEILASRCLCLIFGASLQSFAVVLISFILGIGMGSAVIASPHCRRWPKGITTILLLLGASALIGLLVFHIEKLATLYLYAQGGLSRTLMGYRYHEVIITLISIGVLGLPAAALGSVLPLWMRAVPESSELLGDHVGRLVTWNTLGAVVGVLVTGFVLMPHIGLRASFATLGLLLAAAAIIMALALRRWLATVASVVVGTLVLMAAASGDANWRSVFSIGIFRLSDVDPSMPNSSPGKFFEEHSRRAHLLFYEDAADATVSVERQVTADATNETILLIDGKPDASAYADRPTQLLLAQLPLTVRPESKDVFCFGMGSGITAGSVLGYPIEHLTIAENCAPVLRAVRLFDPWNHGVATNSRVRIFQEDARTVLKLSPQQYDVIISEPSNPWMVGVGRVFSREFYQLAASRLKPGGLMTQWFHLYEMDDKTLDMVLRTFSAVFPNMEIWDLGDNDIILLGSTQPWESDPEAFRPAFELQEPRQDLASLSLMTPQEVLTRQFASQQTAYAIAGPGPIESDNFPILEYAAPRAFYMHHERWGVVQLQDYDERTWQMGLAPLEKNKVLEGLGQADLRPIFGKLVGTGSPQLQSYLNNYFQGRVGAMLFGNRVMPCVFRETNTATVVYAMPSVATNLVSRQLYSAEIALHSQPTKWPQAIQSIGTILGSLRDYNPQEMDWSPAYYADLAVKASLRLGNTSEAKAILLRGLQLEPDSSQLRYLSRILIHEGILQPAEVPPNVVND